jgi:hypothetical protein
MRLQRLRGFFAPAALLGDKKGSFSLLKKPLQTSEPLKIPYRAMDNPFIGSCRGQRFSRGFGGENWPTLSFPPRVQRFAAYV